MMSNREAIALLRNLEYALDSYCELNEEGKTAFRMAIESLELFGNSEPLPSAQPEPCEDAVSKEMVSEWLKQYGQDVLHGKYKFSLMYIWKNLMDLPSVTPKTEQRWIPVTERLPEDDTEVLVYLFEKNKSPYIAWLSDGRWYTEYFEVERENEPVTWMPLPEPYKGGKI